MVNVHIEFEKLDGVTPDKMRKVKVRPVYERVNSHMRFDINMDEKFTRKVRYVAGGQTNAPPSSITYPRVVSIEIINIEFLLA